MPTTRAITLASRCAAMLLVATLCNCSGGSGGSGNAPTAPAPGPGGTPPPPPPPPVGTTFNFAFPGHGISHTYSFPDTGDWHYLCLKHGVDGMRGVVFVRASSLRDSALVSVGQGGNKVYFPDTVTIRPNGHVRWVNVSTDPEHTATSN
jgi:plastocyanin